MQNTLNTDKLLDEKCFEQFPTKYNYRKIFEEISLGRIIKSEAKQIYRELCKSDIYFLIRYAMDRPDINHPYLYMFANIVNDRESNTLYLCARGHYKSTFVTLGKTIQRILRDPDDTHCIFSVTDTIANPFLRQISNELRENGFLRYLFPEIIPEPNSDLLGMEKLSVLRNTRKKEATVESSGVITKMPTSRHYDHMIYDDLVTPETANDPDILNSTYERYKMSLNCVATNYTHLVIGTPYHYEDAYSFIRKDDEFENIILPAEVDGVPVFMTRQALDRKKKILGQSIYNSQMLIDPTPSDQAFFNKDKLVRKDIEQHKVIDDNKRVNRRRFVILDPSISKKKKSDWCVCMAVETFFHDGLLYMDILEYFSIKEGNKNPTRVINIMVDMCLKYNVNNPIIETVAFQEALVYRFKELTQERMLDMYVKQYKPRTDKQARIQGLDPVINFGRMYINSDMTEVIDEVGRFPHSHDDHLDCLSIAQEHTPKFVDTQTPTGNLDRTEANVFNVDRNKINNYNSVRVINNSPYKRSRIDNGQRSWKKTRDRPKGQKLY